MAEWVERPSGFFWPRGVDNPVESNQWNQWLKSNARHFLARRSALLGYGKDWLARCQDTLTEWDIRLWFILLSWISLNSLVFNIRWQLVNRKPELTLLPAHWIFILLTTLTWYERKWPLMMYVIHSGGIPNWHGESNHWPQIRSLTLKNVKHSKHSATGRCNWLRGRTGFYNTHSLCLRVPRCVFPVCACFDWPVVLLLYTGCDLALNGQVGTTGCLVLTSHRPVFTRDWTGMRM